MGRKEARRGFTLIELLVVIAIIAILAAILFPVFAQAREKARMAACQSNLKQMGSALMMYTQDYDEIYPGANPGANTACADIPFRGGWRGWIGNLLQPYTKNTQIYICPSKPNLSGVNRDSGGVMCTAMAAPYFFVSYTFNYNRMFNQATSNIQAPAEQLMMWDSLTPYADCAFATAGSCGLFAQRDICQWMAKNGMPLQSGQACTANANTGWHNNGDNRLFADGHVKWSRWDQVNWGQLANLLPTHAAYNLKVVSAPPAGSGNGIN
jgi:prepilin-type N-terminal cleavage/methylation domain-containing protein/prepilin-type processing-associated H-X9-DG protein